MAADLLVAQLKVISVYEFLKIETSTYKLEVLNAMEKFCETPINLGHNNEFFLKASGALDALNVMAKNNDNSQELNNKIQALINRLDNLGPPPCTIS